jgi:hypothetical protein
VSANARPGQREHSPVSKQVNSSRAPDDDPALMEKDFVVTRDEARRIAANIAKLAGVAPGRR